MLVPSFDRQQTHGLLERLAEHLQEELAHPSQIAELDSSATLVDYCRLFFLKRACHEATKEQNKLLCQLATKQKIYIFNLKKLHVVIHQTCYKVDQALVVFRPQMHIIEEFKQTAAKTRQLQASMLHTIEQSLDTVAQIRTYTFIPNQEGEPPNPLLAIMQEECDTLRTHLAIMQAECDTLRSHLEYVQRLNQENEQAPEMGNVRQFVGFYHRQADDFLRFSQECEEDIKFIRQGTQALRLEDQKLRQEGQELAKDVQEFSKDVAKLRQEGQELAQNVDDLEQDMIGLKQDMIGLKQDMIGLEQDMIGLKQDMIGLSQDMKELSNRAKRYGQRVDEVTKGVKELELWQQNFQSELAFHMEEAKESRYLMEEIQRKIALTEQLLTPRRYSSPCEPAAKKSTIWLKTIISWAWQAPFHLHYKICLIFLSCMKLFQLSMLWSYCKNGSSLLKHKRFCLLNN